MVLTLAESSVSEEDKKEEEDSREQYSAPSPQPSIDSGQSGEFISFLQVHSVSLLQIDKVSHLHVDNVSQL